MNARQIPQNSVNHRSIPHPAKTTAENPLNSYSYCFDFPQVGSWDKSKKKDISAWVNKQIWARDNTRTAESILN